MPVTRLAEFDTWRPGYGLATVSVVKAGTNLLASVFSDEAMTSPIANPITLLERVDSGISYGRLAQPVYIGVPFQLQIDTVDRTGVIRPALATLEDVDASLAVVVPEGATNASPLAVHLSRRIDVRDYGDFIEVGEQGASAATNTATLVSAIGVAGSQGGGTVELPGGTYLFNQITLPGGVILRGQSISATFLQSTFAGNVVIISGSYAGLCNLTLDGITLVGNSIGIYIENQNDTFIHAVLVKRFSTGVHHNGGGTSRWHDLSIDNCGYGYRGHGFEEDTSAGVLQFNGWDGGTVSTCIVAGIEYENDGRACTDNRISGVVFDSNLGIAVSIIGARSISLNDCLWASNTKNLVVVDADVDRTVTDLVIEGGLMTAGTIELSGFLDDVIFRRVDLSDLTVTLNSPGNLIFVENCTETNVTISGASTAWLRSNLSSSGATFGLTTGNAATTTWDTTLEPGEMVHLEAKVIGRRRNGVGHQLYHIACFARRPGATLAYELQTANFTVGNKLTAATSGATARIIADSDSGSTGTLTLIDVNGIFIDNEIITDGATGSAMVNGSVATSAATIVGSVVSIIPAQQTDATYVATFVANGPQIELRVTGATNHNVEWTVNVQIVWNL